MTMTDLKNGITIMPTANGVMCLVPTEEKNLNCPTILDRFICSQKASVETRIHLALIKINSWKNSDVK